MTVHVPIPLGQDLAPLLPCSGSGLDPSIGSSMEAPLLCGVLFGDLGKVPGTVTHARGGASALIQALCSRSFGLALLQP